MKLHYAKPVLALALSTLAALASAGSSEAYTQKRFDELAAQDKPTLVSVHADWCPTYKAQKPVLHELMGQPEFKNVTELVVDFDAQKPVVQQYKVAAQSFHAKDQRQRFLSIDFLTTHEPV